MRINRASNQSFGMAKLSPSIQKRIEDARAENLTERDRARLEKNVETLNKALGNDYVATWLHYPHPVLAKVFPNMKKQEDIYVNGRNVTYIFGIPAKNASPSKRIDALAQALKNIERARKEDFEAYCDMMDDALYG